MRSNYKAFIPVRKLLTYSIKNKSLKSSDFIVPRLTKVCLLPYLSTMSIKVHTGRNLVSIYLNTSYLFFTLGALAYKTRSLSPIKFSEKNTKGPGYPIKGALKLSLASAKGKSNSFK